MSNAPLTGLRILSLAEQFPGPYATMLLSDMGAEVIMIERPGIGDPARQFPPLFRALNRGKRSVALDLKSAEGLARFRELAKVSDVIVEGFRPGKLAALGAGFEDMRGVNPRLVYVSISGYGQDGPYRDRAGHDLSYEGVGGLLADQADAGQPGPVPAIPLADVGAALFADKISARQADDWGMIWEAVADAAFDAHWRAKAAHLAQGPTAAYAAAKNAIRASWDNTLEDQLSLEAQEQGKCGQSRDFKEGVMAFMQKRPASFEGR